MKLTKLTTEPIEGWIDWETRFSTSAPVRVLVANGKPVEQVQQVPEGEKMNPGMKPGVPMQRQERRQDAFKRAANEGKWTNATVHTVKTGE